VVPGVRAHDRWQGALAQGHTGPAAARPRGHGEWYGNITLNCSFFFFIAIFQFNIFLDWVFLFLYLKLFKYIKGI